MSNLKEQLQALIDKSMPSLEANSLKKYIEDCEKMKQEFDVLTRKHSSLSQELEKIKEEHSAMKHKEALVNSREAFVAAEEKRLDLLSRNFEIDKLKYELGSQREHNREIIGLTSLLVKNPRAVEFFSHSRSEQVPVVQNGYTSMMTANNYEQKVIEAAETKDDNVGGHSATLPTTN